MKRAKLLLNIALLLICHTFESFAQGITQFWGMSSNGGSDHLGVIFSLDETNGHLKEQFSFSTLTSGASPTGELLEIDGKFYGTASEGGKQNNGLLFQWDPANNTYNVLVEFQDEGARQPTGYLIADGTTIYGLTNLGGTNGGGIIYKWTPENGFTKLHDFSLEGGWLPNGGLTLNNNKLFGLTSEGGNGTSSTGVIFEFDLSNSIYTVKKEFNDQTGRSPMGSLTFYNNSFFGLTSYGGANSAGSLFEWNPSNNVLTVHFEFDIAEDGANPQGSLVVRNDELYGMTQGGGDNGAGTIFKFKPDGVQFTTLTHLAPATGAYPTGNLYFYDGYFYGLTYGGGDHNQGVFFKMDLDGDYEVVYHLDTFVGTNPKGGLILHDNHFYGLTFRGGASDKGTIFAWDIPNDTLTKSLDFSLNNGAIPTGNLISYNNKLYGLTSLGGSENGGILFEIDPATGLLTKHLDFTADNGYKPLGSLTEVNGIFYGMTSQGGDNDDGVIFEWDPEMPDTYIKKVDLITETGNYPKNNLILYNQKFYGMTYAGGNYNRGTIFEWVPGGNQNDFKLIYSFPISSGSIIQEGNTPFGNFTILGDYLYGMTSAGGELAGGTIFKWKPGDTEPDFLLSFYNEIGREPLGNLTSKDQLLYGMTSKGGSNQAGTLFSFNPANADFQKIADFGGEIGNAPKGSLILKEDKFYGMTYAGGTNTGGTIFEWDPEKQNEPTKGLRLLSDLLPVGSYPMADLINISAPVARGTTGSCTTLAEVVIDETNNNIWVPFKDENGNAVAEIKANGNNLGAVQLSFYVHEEDDIREDANKKLYLNRNITISPENGTLAQGTQVDLRLYILKSELNLLAETNNSNNEPSGINDIDDITIFKSSANTCTESLSGQAQKITSSALEWGEDYVITASITEFSTFFFASNKESALPVNLVDFSAKTLENRIYLEWKTSDEINFSHFEIERSLDGRNFKSILTIPSHNQGLYTAMDEEILWTDYVYYQLKMIDRDQSYHHSKIISVELPYRKYLTIYPNPVTTQLILKPNQAAPPPSHWEIITAEGITIQSGAWNDIPGKINVSSLLPGVYIVGLYSDTVYQRLRFVKE